MVLLFSVFILDFFLKYFLEPFISTLYICLFISLLKIRYSFLIDAFSFFLFSLFKLCSNFTPPLFSPLFSFALFIFLENLKYCVSLFLSWLSYRSFSFFSPSPFLFSGTSSNAQFFWSFKSLAIAVILISLTCLQARALKHRIL